MEESVRMARLVIATIALALFGVPMTASADIVGSILPTSRSVLLGQTATAFATIINAGTTTATSCGLELGTAINADFTFRTTDPNTNEPIVPLQTRVDIPPNQRQSWVFGITPNAQLNPTEVTIRMTCSNTSPAPVFVGLNTLLLSASSSPIPDVIALAATLANDGVVRAPGTRGTGVFSVASANVGAAGLITVLPQIVGNAGGATALICETDVAGNCLAAPAASVSTSVTAGGTNSFGVFVIAHGLADFDPANTRVNVRFNDAGSIVRGAGSVAYTTQTELASGGGTLEFEATTVSLDTNSAWAPVSVNVALQPAPPQPLPPGFGTAERIRDVSVSDPTRLNAPLTMVLDYSPAAIGGGVPFVLHHDPNTGKYDPVTVFAVDPAAGRI